MNKIIKKIVVFGNQKLAIDCLGLLKKNRDSEIVAVIGCETSRDIKQGYPSIKAYCKKNSFAYFHQDKLDKSFIRKFRSFKPDLCFGLMYRNFINKEYLRIPRMGIINFHPSLLPKYRGSVPWVWAMINGESEAGLTVHYMDEGIDTGDIIAQSRVKINDQITGFQLLHQLMDSGVKLFEQQLPLILAGRNRRIKQKHKDASYYGFFNNKVRLINWLEKGNLIIRRVNAVTKPYDGAVGYLMGKEVIIWNAREIKGPNRELRGPGRIIDKYANGNLMVSTVNGYLLIEEYNIKCAKDEIEDILKIGNKFL